MIVEIMGSSKILRNSLAAALAIIPLVMPIISVAAPASSPSPKTIAAVELFQKGKLHEAAALEQQVVMDTPDDWLSHATLSYLAWQQGNALLALDEAERARVLAPDSWVVLTNLARMKDAANACRTAISLYDQAAALKPDDWSARIGSAACYIKLGSTHKGFELLQKMVHEPNQSFDWYYQVGNAYLQYEKPELAAQATDTALKVATTPQQLSSGTCQLVLALLRDNQIERARTLKEQLFRVCDPDSYELFVRAADAFCPAIDPSSAKDLLRSALDNLSSPDNAEGFYRLGRIFENRASFVAYDTDKFTAWSDYARTAHQQAVKLDPMQARYHLALASLLDEKKSRTQRTAELNQVKSLDSFDRLGPFFLEQSTASTDTAGHANLSKIRFSVQGLSCGCHLTKVQAALNKLEETVFCHIANQQPYQGILLMTDSSSPAQDILERCVKSFEPDPNLKTAENIELKVLSQQQIAGAQETVRIAQDAQYGNPVQFYNLQRQLEPVMPVTTSGQPVISLK